jgi:hypothetical protein
MMCDADWRLSIQPIEQKALTCCLPLALGSEEAAIVGSVSNPPGGKGHYDAMPITFGDYGTAG